MTHLTFKYGLLAELLKQAKPQWEKDVRPSYVESLPDAPHAVPAFWLVGDCGVYLMHNGKAHDIPEGRKQPVVYASECNPETMPFDDWWEVKRATFGGDDGVEVIERGVVEQAVREKQDLRIDFEPGELAISLVPRRGARR